MKIFKLEKNVESIIFDIDSTLYTNDNYAYEQVDCQIREFAKENNISAELARKKVSDFRVEWAKNHDNQKISLGNLLVHFGVPIEKSVEWRKTLLEPANFLQKDEKLQNTLVQLSKRYKMICVTNNPVLPAKKTLDAIGVTQYFCDIVGLDTCFKSKPAEEPFMTACKILKSAPELCLSIGDRFDMDIGLPLQMGMSGILVDGVKDVYKLPFLLENKADN